MLEIINAIASNSIQIVAVCIFGLLILKDKNKPKNKIIYNIISICVSIILYTFIFLFLEGLLKSVAFCILFMFTLKLLFKANYVKSLITAIIFVLLLIVPDLLVMVIATEIFQISKEFYHVYIAGGIVGNLLVNACMILLTYLFRKPLRNLINYNFSTSKKIILVSFLTLISIGIFFFHLINTFRLNKDILGYLIVITTLAVILYYLFRQKIENENMLKKYDDLLNVMKTYEEAIEEQRTTIHENRNELMTIKSKINDKEKESKIIKYIDSIIGDKVSSNISKYSKFTYLPSNGIKGFFYYKFIEAEKKGINASVNISKKIEKSFLGGLETKDFKDLVRIIGVYLDNAIEASFESKEKKLGIEIYMIKDNIDIIISNTYKNKIDKNKIGIERFSTKGKKRGHGLLLVKYILNNNNIFESKREITNNLYVQKLTIKNIK